MAMNIGSSDGDDDEVVSAINTTPLVDVMLVMLIIFLVTIPVILKTVNLQLPTYRNIVFDGMLDVDCHGFISG